MQVILNKKEKEELVAKLYQDGKPKHPVDVAIELDLSSVEVENILQEFGF